MEGLGFISFSISEYLLILSLGLKHGLDPDHIAIIDGMTMKHSELNTPYAKWVGTFFAIGHGAVVTLIAISVSLINHTLSIPIWLNKIAEWIPIFLLIFIGLINLKDLIKKNNYVVNGWRNHLIPKKIKNSSNPIAIILIGILFATVFDTATQAAAWGYAASREGGALAAALTGIIFSIGMITTDTIDGHILFKILTKSSKKTIMYNYRKNIGWAIVIMSFTIAFYKTICAFNPLYQLPPFMSLMIGLLFVGIIALFYGFALSENSIKNKY